MVISHFQIIQEKCSLQNIWLTNLLPYFVQGQLRLYTSSGVIKTLRHFYLVQSMHPNSYLNTFIVVHYNLVRKIYINNKISFFVGYMVFIKEFSSYNNTNTGYWICQKSPKNSNQEDNSRLAGRKVSKERLPNLKDRICSFSGMIFIKMVIWCSL